MSKRLILKFLFKIMMLIGATGFIGGALISLGYVNYSKELPLSQANSIQVDSVGNIYLGLEFYGYIQKYSPNGEFIKNWKLKTSSGGVFYIRLIENEIYAYTARGKAIEKYDLNGKFIDKEFNKQAYQDSLNSIDLINNPNCTCEVSGFIDLRIECKNKSINSSTVIKMNFLNRILRGPIPAWLFAFIGLLGSMHFDKE